MPAFAVVKISLQIRACKQRLSNSACQCDPVCPLVHNGMQKFATFAQGDWECTAFLPESVLAPAETHLSSACHCEPVRTLVW